MADEVTLWDGTTVMVPGGMTEGEITNYIAEKMPNKAIERGIAPDIEREYDIRSGVQDFRTRFGASLAQNNPEEIRAEFNNIYGKDNWGISDFGEVYVTPEGLRNIGQEPTSDRKVLVDGSETDIYDLTTDPIPEYIIGATSVAAELAGGPKFGVGAAAGAVAARGFLSKLMSRNLIASSGRAGVGASAGSMGVEGIQTLRGTQRETLANQFLDAGTEGAVVGLASVVLGAPIAAVAGTARRVKQASKETTPQEASNTATLTNPQLKLAEARTMARMGTPDEKLLSLRTLIGDKGTLVGNMISKLEGIGAKVEGDAFTRKILDFMTKYRQIALESKRAGDADATTLLKLNQQLSKSEKQFGVKLADSLNKFGSSKLFKIDDAAKSMDNFNTSMEIMLANAYRQRMAHFASDEMYQKFRNIGTGIELDANKLARVLNDISDESEGAEVVERVLSTAGGNLGIRIKSRVEIDPKTGTWEAIVKKDKSGEPRIDKETGDYILKESGYKNSPVTAQDILDSVKAMKQHARDRKSNFNAAREQVSVSSATLSRIAEEIPYTPLVKELRDMDKAYAQFANLYRGKNGLFSQMVDKAGVDSTGYISRFLSQGAKTSLRSIVEKLDDALGAGSSSAMLSNLGMNFVNDSFKRISTVISQGGVLSKQSRKVAKAEVDKIDSVLLKLKSKDPKSYGRLFRDTPIDEYRKLLSQVANGSTAQATKALEKLSIVPDFKGAASLVKSIETVGSSLSKSNLDDVVAKVRALGKIDPKAAEMYKDLIFSQNWSRIIDVDSLANPALKNQAIKNWADDWVSARNNANGISNLSELFGKELYDAMDDLALTIRGALNIDPNAGALQIADIVPSITRNAARLDVKGTMKPALYMYFLKGFALNNASWKKMRATYDRMSKDGASEEEIAAAYKPDFDKSVELAKKAASAALAGRNGLFAAAISNYLNEADLMYPEESEEMPPKVSAVQQEAPQPPMQGLPQDVGIAAIQQIAQMLGGTGEAALAQGASMARGR